jgi:CheY-like chemotaxis protein
MSKRILVVEDQEELKARAAGCDALVPKPYNPRHLLAKIFQYLA